jgi:hypothetical protein
MQALFADFVKQTENGYMPVGWYFKAPPAAVFRKIVRKCF